MHLDPGATTTDSYRDRLAEWRLRELLAKYPGFRVVPSRTESLTVAGRLAFVAEPRGLESIEDEYLVTIAVPASFPLAIPSVLETANRIPVDFHKLSNGSLCLGSPTRLLLTLSESPSLSRFVDRCLVPYLYGRSYFEKHGVMPFGELKHGSAGIRQDMAALFGVDERCDIGEFVRLASMNRREANKRPCPCGGNRRLGRCHHRRVNTLRDRLGRSWFRICQGSLA